MGKKMSIDTKKEIINKISKLEKVDRTTYIQLAKDYDCSEAQIRVVWQNKDTDGIPPKEDTISTPTVKNTSTTSLKGLEKINKDSISLIEQSIITAEDKVKEWTQRIENHLIYIEQLKNIVRVLKENDK